MATLRSFGALVAACLLTSPAFPANDDRPIPMVMPEWKLLRKVEPVYPPLAVQHRIQGVVGFSAVIAKDGHVESLRLVSGHPLLVYSAWAAARQWVYRRTFMNGQPVRVLTHIQVPFVLDSYGKPPRRSRPPEAVDT